MPGACSMKRRKNGEKIVVTMGLFASFLKKSPNRTSSTSVSVLKMIDSNERQRAQVMVQMENKMKNTHRPEQNITFLM